MRIIVFYVIQFAVNIRDLYGAAKKERTKVASESR